MNSLKTFASIYEIFIKFIKAAMLKFYDKIKLIKNHSYFLAFINVLKTP